MPLIQRLLIANRGEIACRVIRTAKQLGVTTIAVYSDADADAPHVKCADDSVHLGGSAAPDSYLSIEKILAAAKRANADAIHPGYGFLSERAAFAQACEDAGIIFVGPSPAAIELMGDKAQAKRAMIAAGVPCVPGYQGEDQTEKTLLAEAAQIGFPVMVKAAAGGGGRGMRLVHKAKDLPAALALARSEAQNAFGSGALILEKAILRPRHVELQIFGDRHGNVVHLGERDCSVQRRHQKVIEEAPCPIMTSALRQEMGAAAVLAAKSVDYVGAGTVEFLLGQDGAFYFLEMNTRLQVEHPVTEAITGLDLVALQLRVAEGKALGFTQDDVALRGHAIEVRLYAEDPRADFLPSTGRVHLWRPPQGEGVRVDDGIATGGEISPFYDPMVAKIIAHGPDRETARRRLMRALEDTALIGPQNNRDFLRDALAQEPFVAGAATTAFLGDVYGEKGFDAAPSDEDFCLAALVQYLEARDRALAEASRIAPELLDWSSTGELKNVFVYRSGERTLAITIRALGRSFYRAELGAATFDLHVLAWKHSHADMQTPSGRRTLHFHSTSPENTTIAAQHLQFSVQNIAGGEPVGDAAGNGRIIAPMHGKLLEIFVVVGERVKQGQRLAVLEAMKMQHEIVSDVDGQVELVSAAAGTQIAAEDLILRVKPDDAA